MLKDNSQLKLSLSPYQGIYDAIIPANHLLRRIKENIDFSFVNPMLRKQYCESYGRPAKEPEMMFKLLFLKKLYDLSDETLVSSAQTDMAYKTESLLTDLIESAEEESALADVSENGKVKAKDIEAKIDELTSTIETEETIELEVIRMDLHLVNTKKRLEAYLLGHPLCKSAVNENGKITKASIEYRLRIIRTEESVPESLQEDVNQLKTAYELCGKISDYNKVVKELNKALDEKCRARYEMLTDEEILDLLVNRKWFDSIFAGIADLYAAISHRLTNRIVELAERYENTLPELQKYTDEYETKVKSHLERMGFKW